MVEPGERVYRVQEEKTLNTARLTLTFIAYSMDGLFTVCFFGLCDKRQVEGYCAKLSNLKIGLISVIETPSVKAFNTQSLPELGSTV